MKADSTDSALAEAAAAADLMVLGSHGLGGFAGFVLDSVSQRVVARSPRPVVLVRASQAPAVNTCRPWAASHPRSPPNALP
ncbi:universal stress protein [Streptomyces sp. 11x1]|uniref:universal stress protein n=1 Tax=Streptomyces sp. 11x1 TaxID=3038642 RepID=UPI002931A332|nr:universal stress protein [Streptomyces sp. 11x1]